MNAIEVEGISKRYRLGIISRGMLYQDLQSHWARFRGKPDPHAQLNPDGTEANRTKGEFYALKNVTFNLQQGEAMAIIGKNGSGKSTLLKILSQITAPTTGEARIRGRVASMLEVGTGFHSELTGRANVFINGAILGMTKKEIESKFDEIVDFAEIEKFIDTPVKRYSSGMSVRLAFAVAANLAAEILIVDEVLAVGDAEFQRKCLQKMGEVTRSGRTILFVSHNMHTVRNLCTQALCLESGNVVMEGSADDVVRFYMRGSTALHSATVHLAPPPHYVPSYIDSIALLNSNGEPTSEVGFGDQWSCDLLLRSRAVAEGCSAFIELTDSENVTILVHESTVRSLDIGSYRVRFNISQQFRPGIIRLSVGSKSWYKTVHHQTAVTEMLIKETPSGPTPWRNTGGILLSNHYPELIEDRTPN